MIATVILGLIIAAVFGVGIYNLYSNFFKGTSTCCKTSGACSNCPMSKDQDNYRTRIEAIEKFKLKKTIDVNGMTCTHCTAAVAKALEGNRLNDADKAVYEEKKNDKYLFNFLSEEAKAALAAIAMEGKAEYVENKIFSGLVDGRISKHLKEICLMDQVYVKAEDGKQSVAKYIESVNKDLKVVKFVRFEVGEGMEKKNEDFAAEVAAQMAGN